MRGGESQCWVTSIECEATEEGSETENEDDSKPSGRHSGTEADRGDEGGFEGRNYSNNCNQHDIHGESLTL